jgi:hypothetical protein
MTDNHTPYRCPQAILTDKRGRKLPEQRIRKGHNSIEVEYPVSYRYNGGISIDGEWYTGYEVPPPAVPEGFELVSLGVGLQLNAKPPRQTMLLRRIKS